MLAAMLSLAACSGSGPGVRIATDSTLHYDSRGDYAGLQGSITAKRHGDTACYYLNAKSGTYALVFPEGWTTTEDLSLKDAGGSVVIEPNHEAVAWVTPSDVSTPKYCSGDGPARGVLHMERSEG